MYKKLHRTLTFIFSGITAGILIIMSLFYLYLYQKDLTENSFLSFSSEISTLISNLEGQEGFSLEWQAKTTASSSFLLAFYDRNTLLSSCRLSLSEEEINLAAEIYDYALSSYPFLKNSSGYLASHREFLYEIPGESKFYVSAVSLPRHFGTITGVILYDTSPLEGQITRQRLRFALLNALGIFCLFLFSWFYTGKLLSPIQEAHEKQNAFIAAASHELRTPLAVILSAVSASRQGNKKEKERFLNTIEIEVKRMSALVQDMLTLSRADNHNFPLHLGIVELDTLLLETFEAFEPLSREHHMVLSVELPEYSIRRCRCDRERIKQALAILISNAISYGKDEGAIVLGLKEEHSRFLLWVKDNGTGIPDADKPYIFNRFYRGDSSRSQKDHFGLGLCIAKEIMDAHQGKIWVEDTPKGGASFFLELK